MLHSDSMCCVPTLAGWKIMLVVYLQVHLRTSCNIIGLRRYKKSLSREKWSDIIIVTRAILVFIVTIVWSEYFRRLLPSFVFAYGFII